MAMPVSLALLRHGESESNKAKSLFEEGAPCAAEEALMGVHTSHRRLTPLGIMQAQTAGKWLRENWFDETDPEDYRLYFSPYVRAMETAGNLGLNAKWRADIRLVERNWGEFDQLPYAERQRRFARQLRYRKLHAWFWRPTDGETFQDVFVRLRDMGGTLHRECADKKVLMVSHGETMWVWRSLLERMLPQELSEAMLSDDNRIWIHNCRIIEYTRIDEHGIIHPRFVRFRFVNPEDPADPQTNLDWQPIERREWSSEEILEYVGAYQTFLSEAEAA